MKIITTELYLSSGFREIDVLIFDYSTCNKIYTVLRLNDCRIVLVWVTVTDGLPLFLDRQNTTIGLLIKNNFHEDLFRQK
jgi:hypothetical protein